MSKSFVTTVTTREQWMLGNALAGTVRACDAAFCANDNEQEAVNDPGYLDKVAEVLSSQCSANQIENAMAFLSMALQKKMQTV